MKPSSAFLVFTALLLMFTGLVRGAARVDSYAIVVSRATHDDADWKRVVDALVAKYPVAQVIVYDSHVNDALDRLRSVFPRYTCFVATPAEAGKQFVADVHRMTRKLDDDVYTDTQWAILTGYDADNALSIARHSEPLTVRRVASGTEIAMDMVEEGVWYCELVKNRMVRKEAGGEAQELKGPDDTTAALVATLNEYKADLFITSGHATERNWQIGFRYHNGYFLSKEGALFGRDTQNQRHDIHSDNPKVYLPIGNCLMGHIDATDAMALAWMNSAGVKQMIGYTVPTWYGYQGWGCLDYFVEQPGRYTFIEAFFANHHALMHRLDTYFPTIARRELAVGQTMRGAEPSEAAKRDKVGPNEAAGLLFDRDVVAIYGDPAWTARMADRPKAYDQNLTESNGVYTFTITPNRGENSFKPINTNGSQRGWRPMVQFFDHRLTDVEIIEGADLNPVIADDFILVPNPRECDPTKSYKVVFRAKRIVQAAARNSRPTQ